MAPQCDIAADTLSYNSHTTGSDALWSGLPLLTQAGRYLASRVGSSLTAHAGIADAHVSSLKSYEDTITALARAPLPQTLVCGECASARDTKLPPAHKILSTAHAAGTADSQLRSSQTFGTFSLGLGGDLVTHMLVDQTQPAG